MSGTNCPNCNGTMHLSKDSTKWICEYCDSMFPIKNSVSGNCIDESGGQNAESLSEKLFNMKIKYLNEKTEETLNLLCGFIEQNLTVDDYIEGINLATKNDTNFATENLREEVLQTALKNVLNQIAAGESAIFFYNKGLFSKGKDGILVTTESVFRLTKKDIYKIPLENLCSLNATPSPGTYSDWSLNNDDRFNFSLTVNHKVTAIILGLICTLSNKHHSDDYKITIDNQKV